MGKNFFKKVFKAAPVLLLAPIAPPLAVAVAGAVIASGSRSKTTTESSTTPAQYPTPESTLVLVESSIQRGLTANAIQKLDLPVDAKELLRMCVNFIYTTDGFVEFQVHAQLAELIAYFLKAQGRESEEGPVVDFALLKATASSPVAPAQLVLHTTTKRKTAFIRTSSSTSASAKSLGFSAEETAKIAELLRDHVEANAEFRAARDKLTLPALPSAKRPVSGVSSYPDVRPLGGSLRWMNHETPRPLTSRVAGGYCTADTAASPYRGYETLSPRRCAQCVHRSASSHRSPGRLVRLDGPTYPEVLDGPTYPRFTGVERFGRAGITAGSYGYKTPVRRDPMFGAPVPSVSANLLSLDQHLEDAVHQLLSTTVDSNDPGTIDQFVRLAASSPNLLDSFPSTRCSARIVAHDAQHDGWLSTEIGSMLTNFTRWGLADVEEFQGLINLAAATSLVNDRWSRIQFGKVYYLWVVWHGSEGLFCGALAYGCVDIAGFRGCFGDLPPAFDLGNCVLTSEEQQRLEMMVKMRMVKEICGLTRS